MITTTPTTFDGHTAKTTLSIDGRAFDLQYRAHNKLRPPRNWGDVWLPLALFPAMRLQRRLRLGDPVSPRLSRSMKSLQGLLHEWYPEFRSIAVEHPAGTVRVSRRRRVAQFFTGGVDSFSTLRANPDVEVLVYGHDLVHDVEAVRERISSHLARAAHDTGRELLEIDMDVRRMLDEFGEWGGQTHGAVLASIGALAGRTVGDILIPSTHSYSSPEPWGSHPMLDHLWTSDQLAVVHDGAELSRFEKIRLLDATALRYLRVCWQTTTTINCSECEKCVRTMTSLEILGRLDEATTFRAPLPLSRLRTLDIRNASDRAFTIENLEAAARAGRGDIVDALRSALAG
ncbi:hypothetical protein [Agromyces sp. LHK192]|uniref:hypothetical protein n=1 Tax=Agromyces sp. LHK192 TaxID=2498704 RepID=UPI000FDC4F10|nr:hypothetical protein [Agromyces sp. LHK192]